MSHLWLGIQCSFLFLVLGPVMSHGLQLKMAVALICGHQHIFRRIFVGYTLSVWQSDSKSFTIVFTYFWSGLLYKSKIPCCGAGISPIRKHFAPWTADLPLLNKQVQFAWMVGAVAYSALVEKRFMITVLYSAAAAAYTVHSPSITAS